MGHEIDAERSSQASGMDWTKDKAAIVVRDHDENLPLMLLVDNLKLLTYD